MIYSGEMVWFVGVVEERNDPKQMGRVKVRCFGIHDVSREDLPTKDLPWASIMLPTNSAGTGTVGQSATGIVQGAWVVGFFTDGKDMQQPLVMGVLPSTPSEIPPEELFSDPSGVNPSKMESTDQPLHASERTYKTDWSYLARKTYRVYDVECAVPPRVSTLTEDEPDRYYERPTWTYPEPHNGNSPKYPYNKVTASESGHVIEIDDTPGASRLATFHNSGTNNEMLDNGDRTTTIVGDDYKVVIKNNNIVIYGNYNLTVEGDMRTLVKGNYHLEVEGDKTEKINNGSRRSKISNSEHTEIGQDFGSNVKVDYVQRVGGMETRTVDSDRISTIGGRDDITILNSSNRTVHQSQTETVVKADIKMVGGTHTLVSNDDMRIETRQNLIMDIDHDKTVILNDGNLSLSVNKVDSSKGNVTENISSNVTENVSGNQTTSITGNLDVDAARIDLN